MPVRKEAPILRWIGVPVLVCSALTVPALGQERFSHVETLTAGPVGSQAKAGLAVALRDGVAVVGLPGEDRVEVFRWNGRDGWEPAGLEAGELIGPFSFGLTVALGEGRMAVGAPLAVPGRVRVFRGESFLDTEELRGEGEDRFGFAIAIEDGYLAVGAPRYDNGRGAVYVYELPALSLVRTLTGAAAGDQFGTAVAMSEDLLVVGAPFTENGGAVYVYGLPGFLPPEEFPDPLLPQEASPADAFGFAVAVAGETVVVGAPQDSREALSAGAVYVFSGDSSRRMTAEEETQKGAQFGVAVAADGETLLVGARRQGPGNQGKVYRFKGAETSWERMDPLPDPGRPGGEFGVAVAVEGEVALVGAYKTDDERGEAFTFGRRLMDGRIAVSLEKTQPADDCLISGRGATFGLRISNESSVDVEGVGVSMEPAPGLGKLRWWRLEDGDQKPEPLELDDLRLPASDAVDLTLRFAIADTVGGDSHVTLTMPPGVFSGDTEISFPPPDVDPSARLSVDIRGPQLVFPEEGVDYRIDMVSEEVCRGREARLDIFVPRQLVDVKVEGGESKPDCQTNGSKTQCSLRFLPEDYRATVRLWARVDPSASGTGDLWVALVPGDERISNPGQNDCGSLESDEAYAQATCDRTSVAVADGVTLSVTFDDSGLEEKVPGDQVVVPFKVGNDGPLSSNDTLISLFFEPADLLDAQLDCDLEDVTVDERDGWTRISGRRNVDAGAALACRVEGLISPATTAEKLRLRAAAEAAMNRENDYAKACDGLPTDLAPGPGSTCESVEHALTQDADLSVELEPERKRIGTGERMEYTLTVINNGNRSVGGITVKNEFDPEELTEISVSCDGGEVVDPSSSSHQRFPAVAASQRGFFVAWFDEPEFGPPAIRARRYSLDGLEMGEAFQVDTTLMNDIGRPSVSMSPNGNTTVVVWRSGATIRFRIFEKVFVQGFDPAEGSQDVDLEVDGSEPVVTVGADGEFWIFWLGEAPVGGKMIRGRHFSGDGGVEDEEDIELGPGDFSQLASVARWNPKLGSKSTSLTLAWKQDDTVCFLFNAPESFDCAAVEGPAMEPALTRRSANKRFAFGWVSFEDGAYRLYVDTRGTGNGHAQHPLRVPEEDPESDYREPALTVPRGGEYLVVWHRIAHQPSGDDAHSIEARLFDERSLLDELQLSEPADGCVSSPAVAATPNHTVGVFFESDPECDGTVRLKSQFRRFTAELEKSARYEDLTLPPHGRWVCEVALEVIRDLDGDGCIVVSGSVKGPPGLVDPGVSPEGILLRDGNNYQELTLDLGSCEDGGGS